MRFSVRPVRPAARREAVVPMINVVFLLLIFFLISAAVAPPDPVDVLLPGAETAQPAGETEALYVAADGTLAYGATRGEAALNVAAGAETLDIRADAALPAEELAALLVRLAGMGVRETRLITVRE